jgi:hypothetical protein
MRYLTYKVSEIIKINNVALNYNIDNNTLNILHLEYRTDRELNFKKEIKEQEIKNVTVWLGVQNRQIPFLAIMQGFKRIVQHAKNENLPYVHIAEDDFCFTDLGAWDYYIANTPKEFDLYLGMIYEAELNENSRITRGFCGLTLFTVHSRFYDTFLSMHELNNADRELGRFAENYKYIVCNPFVCQQLDGFSDNKNKTATYGHLLEGRKLFNRNIHF